MDILLPIKPKYVKFIREGLKRVELRKTMNPAQPIEKIFIYESSPVQKICGYFRPREIRKYELAVLWEKTKSLSCVSESDFMRYYEGRNEGTAIFFDEFISGRPIKLQPFFAHAPQNYAYLEVEISEKIEALLFDCK